MQRKKHKCFKTGTMTSNPNLIIYKLYAGLGNSFKLSVFIWKMWMQKAISIILCTL